MSKFKELSRCEIDLNKNVVISVRDDGKFSVAQVVEAPTGGKPISIFIKNAITTDIAGLKALRESLNAAIGKIEAEACTTK